MSREALKMALGVTIFGGMIYYAVTSGYFKKVEVLIDKLTGQKTPITGSYSCPMSGKLGGLPFFDKNPNPKSTLIITEIGGVVIAENGNEKLKLHPEGSSYSTGLIPLGKSNARLTFTFNPPKMTVAHETIIGSITYKSNYSCILETSAVTTITKKDEFIKSVFIRPCPGELYESFNKDGKIPKTRVGGGTMGSVCKDLLDSGVTDIFMPLKSDDYGNAAGCGKDGDVLFASDTHPESENEKFREQRKLGFDPLKDLVLSCRNTYWDNGKKKVKFHGWFPVFKDMHAAAIGPLLGSQTEYWVFKSKSENCKSTIYADPENEEIFDYNMTLLNEAVATFALSGINLDYIRYPDLGGFRADLPKECNDANFEINSDAVTAFVKRVREEFPTIILSADVRAGPFQRIGVGQDGMLPYLDVIMPMSYTYFAGFKGDEEVKMWVNLLLKDYPQKSIVPIIRGWYNKVEDPRSSDPLKGTQLDFQAVKQTKASGFSIFTYDSLIDEGTLDKKKLTDIKKKIGYE